MGTKEKPGDYDCHANAAPNEPLFTLLGRDPTSGALVRLWVRLRTWLDPASVEAERAKYEEALCCADQMDQWAVERGKASRVEAVGRELHAALGVGNAGRLRAKFETQEIDEGNGVTMVIESPQGDRVRVRNTVELREYFEAGSREPIVIEHPIDTPRADAAIAMLDEIVRVFRNDDGTIASTTTPREIVEYCEQRAAALRRERARVELAGETVSVQKNYLVELARVLGFTSEMGIPSARELFEHARQVGSAPIHRWIRRELITIDPHPEADFYTGPIEVLARTRDEADRILERDLPTTREAIEQHPKCRVPESNR